jgi:hypothetical protein
MDVDLLLERLQQRRTDREASGTIGGDGLAKLGKALPDTPSKAYRYVVGSMEPLEPKYTEIAYREAGRITNQLAERLGHQGFAVEFEHQGSVTNGTHIKVYSDIDVLVCTKTFWFVQPPVVPTRPYQGNPIDHLLEMRAACDTALRGAFPEATVDSSGSKSIRISGGSPFGPASHIGRRATLTCSGSVIPVWEMSAGPLLRC